MQTKKTLYNKIYFRSHSHLKIIEMPLKYMIGFNLLGLKMTIEVVELIINPGKLPSQSLII